MARLAHFLRNVGCEYDESCDQFHCGIGNFRGPVPPGVADVPFAISSNWFNGVANCDSGIQFSPTGANGCAGWHVFDQTPANANKLRATIDGLEDGSYQSPGITPGQTNFTFTGGEVSSAFHNLIDLWDTKKAME